MDDLTILKYYTKNNSVIGGNFPISTYPLNCFVEETEKNTPQFIDESGTPPPPPVPPVVIVSGCTDINASNYNPFATIDDGSCTYPVAGCTNPSAANYNPLATIDDGSCIYSVYGCTVTNALNYNPIANVDDGSCIFCKKYVPYINQVPQTGYANIIGSIDGYITYNTSDCGYCWDYTKPLSGIMDLSLNYYNIYRVNTFATIVNNYWVGTTTYKYLFDPNSVPVTGPISIPVQPVNQVYDVSPPDHINQFGVHLNYNGDCYPPSNPRSTITYSLSQYYSYYFGGEYYYRDAYATKHTTYELRDAQWIIISSSYSGYLITRDIYNGNPVPGPWGTNVNYILNYNGVWSDGTPYSSSTPWSSQFPIIESIVWNTSFHPDLSAISGYQL